MENIEKIISDLNSDIVCNIAVGTRIQDFYLFESIQTEMADNKFGIGKYNNYNIIIDSKMNFNDLRIFNTQGIELINLSHFEISPIDLV